MAKVSTYDLIIRYTKLEHVRVCSTRILHFWNHFLAKLIFYKIKHFTISYNSDLELITDPHGTLRIASQSLEIIILSLLK